MAAPIVHQPPSLASFSTELRRASPKRFARSRAASLVVFSFEFGEPRHSASGLGGRELYAECGDRVWGISSIGTAQKRVGQAHDKFSIRLSRGSGFGVLDSGF